MILTTQGRILSLTHLGTLLVGIAVGVWWATPETYTVPPSVPVVVVHDAAPRDPASCDTEVVPAPKSKVTLPDGTTIETDEPIRYSASRTGAGRDFAGSGEARGPSLRTDNADVAGKLNLTSGTPAVPMPGGSGPLNQSKEGGGRLDFKTLGSRGNLILLGAGILILCATGYGIYSVFPVSRKQAALIGGVGLPLGGVLVLGGTNTDLFNQAVLAALGLAVVGGLVYAWHMGVFAKAAKKLHAYDKLADFYWDEIIAESPDALNMKDKAERLAPSRGLVEAHNSLL